MKHKTLTISVLGILISSTAFSHPSGNFFSFGLGLFTGALIGHERTVVVTPQPYYYQSAPVVVQPVQAPVVVAPQPIVQYPSVFISPPPPPPPRMFPPPPRFRPIPPLPPPRHPPVPPRPGNPPPRPRR